MKVGLKTLLAACLGGVGLAFTVGTAALLEAQANQRIRSIIGEQLHGYAGQVADKLDRGMFERYRDLVVATSLETIRSPSTSRDSRRAVLQRLQDTYRDYAWIGFITPSGILEAATGRVYEGADVSARGWWKQGFDRPYVGDVHEAVVLAKLLYADRQEPPRFVDFAAPVKDEGGLLIGVVAAHLSWEWASEVERSVLSKVAAQRQVDAMILDANDIVIMGPKALIGQRIATLLAPGEDKENWFWPDGGGYLSSVAVTQGYRDYPGLGWKVMLREPVATALAPATELRNSIMIWGGVASLLAVLVGYLMATWLSAPLCAVSLAVADARRSGRVPDLPATSRYAEVETLTSALQSYIQDNRQAERRLRASLDEKTVLVREIHHRVKNNLQVVYGLMMVEMRQLPKDDAGRKRIEALARRITAMGRLHEQLYLSGDLARVDIGEHLRQLSTALLDLRPNDAVCVETDVQRAFCTLEIATPLGLIASELITNSLKHAFPDARAGAVVITLRAVASQLVLTVADDGVGSPGTLPAGGIGMSLITALVRQVSGTLAFDGETGIRATVTVPTAL